MATFVIGDMHGNLPALTDLLGQVEPLLTCDDTLVILGDYIDRGPDARGCVDRILHLSEQAAAKVVAPAWQGSLTIGSCANEEHSRDRPVLGQDERRDPA